MTTQELYDKICNVLTWYEHPDECPYGKASIHDLMYETLIEVEQYLNNLST